MVSAIQRMDTLYHLAKAEIAQFSQRSGLSYAAMAKRSGMGPVLLQGLSDPETWSPTLKTVRRIYQAFHDHEDWPGRDAGLWKETSGEDGSLLRRVYPDWESTPFFDEMIATWRAAKDGTATADAFKQFDNTSVIRVENEDPFDFVVVIHARQAAAWTRGSFEGRRIRDLDRPGFYLEAFATDLLNVRARQEPVLTEVVWSTDTMPTYSQFWRLILPMEPYLVSCLHIIQSGVAAELEQAENAASR